MAFPLIVTPDSILRELGGAQIQMYLRRLSSATGTSAQDADVLTFIEEAAQEAQSEVERTTKCHLTRRIVKCPPLDNGETCDIEDDAYDFNAESWETFVDIQLRYKPVVSVDSIFIRYGQGTDSIKTFTLPSSWVQVEHRTGMLHIIPYVGLGQVATSQLLLLASMGSALMNQRVVPNVVCVNYQTGFCPADFDPATGDLTDPVTGSPFEDIRELAKAVRYIAATNLLRRVERSWMIFSGSISVGGVSQSRGGPAFATAIQDYESKISTILAAYRKPQIAFFTV